MLHNIDYKKKLIWNKWGEDACFVFFSFSPSVYFSPEVFINLILIFVILQTFLSMFVDEGVTMGLGRRQSTTADDNPPSPLGIDPSEMFLSQQPSTGSPAPRQSQTQARADSFRFHSPMTPPSNPHTPSSPGSARLPGVSWV